MVFSGLFACDEGIFVERSLCFGQFLDDFRLFWFWGLDRVGGLWISPVSGGSSKAMVQASVHRAPGRDLIFHGFLEECFSLLWLVMVCGCVITYICY